MTSTSTNVFLVCAGLIAVYLLLPTSLPSLTFRSASHSTMTPPKLSLRLSAPNEVSANGPVPITVQVTHDRAETVSVLHWNSPLAPKAARTKGAFIVTDVETGASAAASLMLVNHAVPSSVPPASGATLSKIEEGYLNDFVTVPAGHQGLTVEVDLVEGPERHKPFSLQAGHRYKVESKGRFHDYYVGELDRGKEYKVPLTGDFGSRATWETAKPIEVVVV